MRFYHGTVSTYLDGIMAEGLQPQQDKKWHAKFNKNDPFEQTFAEVEAGETYVYISPDEWVAETFAISKANYLHAEPGTGFAFRQRFWDEKMYKTNDGAQVDKLAKPVVLEIELPDDWKGAPDPRSAHAYITNPIPAKYIKKVIPVAA